MKLSNMFKTSTENIISKLIANKYPYKYTFYLTRDSIDWNFIMKHIDKLNSVNGISVAYKELGRIEIKLEKLNDHSIIIMSGEKHRHGLDVLTELNNYYKDSAKVLSDKNYSSPYYNGEGIV